MPAINFLARYADAVAGGAKRQTVRRQRKRPIAPGDALYLYTGMRTKACRRLLVTQCRMTRELRVTENGTLKLDGQALYAGAIDQFARNDGLRDWNELRAFIERRYGLPFDGVVIYW